MLREHSHKDRYITRIVHKEIPTTPGIVRHEDWLQLICEEDGMIFEEHKITDGATNG